MIGEKIFDDIIKHDPQTINTLRSGDTIFDRSLLMEAAFRRDRSKWEKLFAIPHDLSIVNKIGWNVFHCVALYDDNVRMMEDLVTANVDGINQRNVLGLTPLHEAAYRNQHQMIRKMLTSSSIDVNIRNNGGELADEYSLCDDTTKEIIRSFR